MDQDLNVSANITKILEENMGVNLCGSAVIS